MEDHFIKTEEAKKILNVHTLTLHNWEKAGKIETIRTGGGHRLYNVDKYLRENKKNYKNNEGKVDPTKVNKIEKQDEKNDEKDNKIKKVNKNKEKEEDIESDDESDSEEIPKKVDNEKKTNVCYLRVSSVGSKPLLKKEVDYMKQKYPTYTIIQDIGSSFNFNKEGLKKVVEMATEGKIDKLIITGNSNISDYGYEMLKHFIEEKHGGKIIVDGPAKDKDSKKDIIDDMMTTLSSFSKQLTNLRNSL